MSLQLNGSAHLYRTDTLPGNPLTVCFWMYISVDADDDGYWWALGTDTTIGVSFDGITPFFYGATQGFTEGTSLTVGQWYHISYIRNGTSNVVYVDGVQNISVTSTTTTAATFMMIGADSGGGNAFNGRICSFKLWNAALTLAEVQRERESLNVVRTQNLNNFLPLLNHTELVDFVTASSMTSSGTLATAEHPSIPWVCRTSRPLSYAFSTFTQEGFRWRNDDGSETTATWAATQDTNFTAPVGSTKRLRILVDKTG